MRLSLKSFQQLYRSFLSEQRPEEHRDPLALQRQLLASVSSPVVFDVGAYVGDVSRAYRAVLPECRLYCFEPSAASFARLKSWADGEPLTQVFAFALSDEDGEASFNINVDPTCSSLLARPRSSRAYYAEGSEHVDRETVTTRRLDRFCREHAIDTIDVLKLDVEGAELRALAGAEEMLRSQRIRAIYTEVMFVSHYAGGALYHDIAAELASRGYSLVDFFDLKLADNGQLRWGNALFLNGELRRSLDEWH